MFGIRDLKSHISVTDTTVECCVRDCTSIVPRQKNFFKRLNIFKCPKHNIYISPSTFEYCNELDNLLWKDETDQSLLNEIKRVKRESRMAHDNSEDAVTWNVFRFLEKESLLSNCLLALTGKTTEKPEAIYWSYSQRGRGVWTPLKTAREEFESKPEEGSEPDIIILTDDTLFFVEAKLTSTNNTTPPIGNGIVKKKYTTGGSNWFSEAFSADFETVALSHKKYELLRLWLLGSWIAENLHLSFNLINVTPFDKEKRTEEIFKPFIRETRERVFQRVTWEDIQRYIARSDAEGTEKERMIDYFENKTIGYGKNGDLRKAFHSARSRRCRARYSRGLVAAIGYSARSRGGK